MIAVKQALVILLGLVVSGAMVVLGIWQLDVYRSQGERVAAQRANGAPVDLRSVAPAGRPVENGFGRPVHFTGTYLPRTQLLLPADGHPGTVRVLTALQQADGSVVPIVRGLAKESTSGPAVPSGVVTQTGVLLPSEETAGAPAPGPSLTSVRLPALAQQWPGPLVGGFVSLASADSVAQGLEATPLDLPQARGRLRNGAYALQWWLFAAFALGMAIRMARDVGRRPGWSGVDGIDSEPHGDPA